MAVKKKEPKNICVVLIVEKTAEMFILKEF